MGVGTRTVGSLLAGVLLLSGLAGCSPPGPAHPNPRPSTAGPGGATPDAGAADSGAAPASAPSAGPEGGAAEGTYTGAGTGVGLHFRVTAGGTAISGLGGHAGYTCVDGGGAYQDLTFTGGPHVTPVAGGHFDDTFDTSDAGGSSQVRFAGDFDAAGGAAGSLTIKTSTCRTDVTWSAALPGRASPPPPASAAPIAPAPAGECSPQPCGIATSVTLRVSRFIGEPASPSDPQGEGVLVVTFTNADTRTHGILANDLVLTAAGAPVKTGNPPQGPDGSSLLSCASSVSVAPGETSAQESFCFPYGAPGQAAGPFSLTWHVGNEEQSSTIELPEATG